MHINLKSKAIKALKDLVRINYYDLFPYTLRCLSLRAEHFMRSVAILCNERFLQEIATTCIRKSRNDDDFTFFPKKHSKANSVIARSVATKQSYAKNVNRKRLPRSFHSLAMTAKFNHCETRS